MHLERVRMVNFVLHAFWPQLKWKKKWNQTGNSKKVKALKVNTFQESNQSWQPGFQLCPDFLLMEFSCITETKILCLKKYGKSFDICKWLMPLVIPTIKGEMLPFNKYLWAFAVPPNWKSPLLFWNMLLSIWSNTHEQTYNTMFSAPNSYLSPKTLPSNSFLRNQKPS